MFVARAERSKKAHFDGRSAIARSRGPDMLEVGVQYTPNYAESKAKSAKTTLIKPWDSCVEYDDQDNSTREKVKVSTFSP
jgi:hypothetical protein